VNAVCLVVAGVVRAMLPGPEFTLAWEHSVQKSRWEERYRVDGEELTLVEAKVAGSGAGMEPPDAARLGDGMYSWRPGTTFPELRLTHSGYTGDYVLCAGGVCHELATLTGPLADGEAIAVRPCR
jgi:hypothetical protein